MRPKLAQLARSLGDDAHVFVPTDEDRGSIEKEFNDFLHRDGLRGIKLPGMLVLDRPLGDERSGNGCAKFISFEPLLKDTGKVDSFIEQLKRELLTVKYEMKSKNIGLEKALAYLQLKPSIWGFGYDLKPFVMKLLGARRA